MKPKFLNPQRFAYSLYLVVVIAILASVANASAAEEAGLFNLYAEIGIEGGGDQLVSIHFDDGFVDDVNAGDGFSIAFGTAYYLPTASFQGTVGYKSDSVEGRNNATLKLERFSFNRIKFDGLAFHHHERHALGAGLTLQTSIEFDAPQGDVFDADDATGFLAEYRYYFSDSAHLGLRYTNIDYTLNGSEGQKTTVDGNAFGFYLGGSF